MKSVVWNGNFLLSLSAESTWVYVPSIKTSCRSLLRHPRVQELSIFATVLSYWVQPIWYYLITLPTSRGLTSGRRQLRCADGVYYFSACLFIGYHS